VKLAQMTGNILVLLIQNGGCTRAVPKVPGLVAVHRYYAEGGGDMPSCSDGGNVVVA
jgi:hypothetical protein